MTEEAERILALALQGMTLLPGEARCLGLYTERLRNELAALRRLGQEPSAPA